MLFGLLLAQPSAESQPAPQPKRPPLRLDRTTVWRTQYLIRGPDVLRLRRRCGTSSGGAADAEYGRYVGEYQKLKRLVDQNITRAYEPGGLYPVAFMHLVSGQPGIADAYTSYVERVLADNKAWVLDFDDVAAALDWCGDAISDTVRTDVATQLTDAMQRLRDEDSFFEHVLTNPKLCHVAVAVALQGQWQSGSPQAERVSAVIDAAKAYFEKNLTPLVKQLDGTAPTPGIRSDFEADVVLAAEVWQSLDSHAWERLRDAMGHSLDVYFWSDTQWPGLRVGVWHDAGSDAPLSPGLGTSAMAAGIAELLAERTDSPVAAYYAEQANTNAGNSLGAREAQRLWLRIVYGQPDRPRVDRGRAPLARRLGNGWVLMRSNWGPGATLLAFDAGQPFWLPSQHLDAGQFQVIRKGRLAIDSGDDVRFEATRLRGGEQRIGTEPGDFDAYSSGTIAHNCIALAELREASLLVGRQWVFLANQRRPEVPRGPVPADISASPRATGRLIAFDTNENFTFVAADLARAYGVRTALVYERSILALNGGLMFICDRLVTANPDIKAAWVMHLPTQPTVGGAPLNPQLRRRKEGQKAGSWVYPSGSGWVGTEDGEGRLFARALLPTNRKLHIIGGPDELLTIPRGPSASRKYLGSSDRGFEYWLSPAMLNGGANAWYRLVNPGTLGPAFGVGGGWGRMEFEAADKGPNRLFVTALYACDKTLTEPPELDVRIDNDHLVVKTKESSRDITITLSPGGSKAGSVEIVDPIAKTKFSRDLEMSVAPDKPLPTEN